jgi:hypothetical protein
MSMNDTTTTADPAQDPNLCLTCAHRRQEHTHCPVPGYVGYMARHRRHGCNAYRAREHVREEERTDTDTTTPQRSVTVGRRSAPGSVYIGRPSVLGNPFVMRAKTEEERARVCDQYAVWLHQQIDEGNPAVLAELKRLRRLSERPDGVTLGCYCSPMRCHGDSIRAAIMDPAPVWDVREVAQVEEEHGDQAR